MSISADVVRSHIAYSAWANRRLMDAAATLSPDELTRDFGTADKSVLGTLFHLFGAERVWLERFEGIAQTGPIAVPDQQLSTLETEWPVLADRWRAYADRLKDTDLDRLLDYRDLRGNAWRQPLWQLALHVVNHSTHHRGQVAGFLRALGRTPPPLDLVRYYRDLNAN